MPAKLQFYAQMADHTAEQITGSYQQWTAFLTTAARLYKYPYHEQLMIFAQRPEATACAEYDLWNNRMHRYVRRGSRGIALIDTTGDYPKLRYVFDVSDTSGRENARRPYLWQYRQEHEDAVTAALERRFAVSGEKGLADQLERVAAQLVDEYWNDNQYDILGLVEGSFLEENDDFNIEAAFRSAATVSTTYALLSRCGLEPENHFEHEDFLSVFDFNTPATVAALGAAISQSSEQVLRHIEVTIKNYERQKLAERSGSYERTDLREERGLPDSQSEPVPAGGAAPGQVRQDAEELPEGASPSAVEQPAAVREAVSASAGDRRGSEPASGADDARTDEGGGRDGGTESQRPDEVGGPDEHTESAGGGNHPGGTGVQLNLFDAPAGAQLSMFPTEAEQIQSIMEAESAQAAPFASSLPQEDIDHLLRLGSNTEQARLKIVNEFMKQKSFSELTAFVKQLYHDGYGLQTGNGSISSWADEDGLHITRGTSVRYALTAQVLSWEDATARIGELLVQGRFATNVELTEAPGFERQQVAQSLWYLCQDMSDEARKQEWLPTIRENRKSGFPEDVARLEKLLEDPDSRQTIAAELDSFALHWRQNPSAMRFRIYKPDVMLQRVNELSIPRRRYPEGMTELPAVPSFITEDEIDATLSRSGSFEGGAGRIYSFWQQEHTPKEKADFLKHEYGTGGGNNKISHNFSSWEDHNSKGIVLRKPDAENVTLSWAKVAKRIDSMVAKDRYLTPEAKAAWEQVQTVAEAAPMPQPPSVQPFIPTAQKLTQEDIDDALRKWSGNPESKRAVVRYMEQHGREKDTAAWLSKEYGGDPSKPLHFTLAGTDTDVVMPWPKVQRRIAQLIKEDRFFTEEEQDHFDDIDPVAIREALAQRGIVNGEVVDPEALDSDPFIRQVMSDAETVAQQPVPAAENFRITDDNLGVGGPKAKFRANLDAINLLKTLEAEGRQATPAEQEVLSRYVGWGGLADAFDESKPAWAEEYQELATALTPEEYTAARSSTLNAHYTSPTIIKAIYEAVGNMGFQTGNILEPSMGVGNFFGLLPEEMGRSRLYGVELDSITGRIAKQLYPKADITVAGFETTDRRDFYDLAVGNVPFGQYQVNDRAYNKLGFSIHDYFFAKTLDQVRPGGVIAFVTSRYTMDKQSPEVRKYIAQRAELLGAIRLPNNAFKANAGTDVVSDIIFLQKRDRPIDIEPDWVHLGKNEDGFAINSYFLEHPEMILGRQSSESTQYGRQDFTVEPIEGLELADQLHDAVKYIRGTYQEAELPDLGDGEAIDTSIPADPNVKNYSYTVVDGEVYFRENSRMVKPELNATAKARVKGLVELRDCVHRLIDLQMWESDPVEIRREQQRLNELYDAFSAKYGLINDRGNRLAFADDSSYYLLCSLEVLDEDGKLERKADMFSKRTIKQARAVTSVDTASEALAVSIAEKARVDMPYMSQLSGKSEEELVSELRGVIFRLPEPVDADGNPRYVTADEYLSGNVRQKLARAREAARDFPEYFQTNVEALEAAQPKDLDASEIDVRLGATWIDKKYIQQFMEELLNPPYYLRRGIQVGYSEFTAEWNITGKTQVSFRDVNAYMTYGTSRANAYRILEDTLNLRDVRIYDTVEDPDGKERRVLNQKETTLAQQKQQAIKDAFRDWIWKDPERRQTLVQLYNERFNSTRPREYDGSHITFGGMNPEITLREHQLNAIAHVLYGGNTLLAHEVGSGKTFEMVAAAMESKRLGLCQKSLFAVPNHLTEQWASEFLRLYPSANILVATKKDFEARNRKKFCAKIATGDYDAVIIGHSQFERIPVSQERQERLLQEQIAEIEDGLDELRSSGAERFTIKSLERTKKSLETRLKKLQDSTRKDDVVTFEQLGVDRLFVDEAHSYKNLFLYTKMRNVAGLSTTDAQKSSDMLLKCRYIDELTGGKGVVFATGTPVSNSMTELYTMMRYLQHDMLKDHGWAHFDCWASQFGETKTAIELAPEGTGYRARTRFAKFFNLPELITLWKEAADVKTADQLNLPRPTAVYHNEVAQPTEQQQALVQELSKRAALVHSGSVDSARDNMLKITSDGRKLGLDQRIINPDLPDDPGSKVNLCVSNIKRIWEDGQADRLTQLVFCDISTPKGRSAPEKIAAKAPAGNLDSPELHALESLIPESEAEPQFSVYEDIRSKLIAQGIPAEQIAFIHDANTEARKKELFAKVRTGQVRVLIGSTFKMGAGMNVQDRLIALHDLDCPWRPGDLEQRSGRIIRQGNLNPEVHIYRYVTEGTFDSYLWVRHDVA